MMNKRGAVVAIVGRPNVGKSELFNRIARRKISIVYNKPGVTRDRIQTSCHWDGIEFDLIDTGGVGLEDESGFEDAIEREVSLAMEVATDILFVVDGREGLHVLDEEVARRLRRIQRTKRIFLVINKIDTPKHEILEADFKRLGFKHVLTVSAAHGRGIEELMEEMTSHWPSSASQKEELKESEENEEQKSVRLGIVGRPNVGKSSLVNALLGEERVIVSPVAGTTRDAVDVEFERDGKRYTLIDTAGMRKKSRISDPLEQAMTSRSAHVIDRSHIALLVVDAIAGVGEQEKKIAGLIQKAHKPCIVVVNKWDLAEEELARQRKEGVADSSQQFQKKYQKGLLETLFFLPYARVLFTSAKSPKKAGSGSTKLQPLDLILSAIGEVKEASQTAIGTGELNRILQKAIERQPPPRIRGRSFKIYYATQIDKEVPTFNVFINQKALLSESYLRYLEQNIRRVHPLPGVPIVWLFKEKQHSKKL